MALICEKKIVRLPTNVVSLSEDHNALYAN